MFVGQGIFLSYYHLEICCILEDTNLTRKLKVRGPKINRSRKVAQGLTRRTRTRHWFVTLVFFYIQEDARIWAHKIFTWKHDYLKAGSCRFFPEHRVPYFWSPWTPFRGYWSSAACSGHEIILVEAAGKCQLPVSRVPSQPHIWPCFWGISWPLCPAVLGRLLPRSREDSIDRPLSVLLLDQALRVAKVSGLYLFY